MVYRPLLLRFVGLWLLFATLLWAGTPGSFRGVLVESPGKAKQGWIYVRGRNGLLRQVEVAKARVVYEDGVPRKERRSNPGEALIPGAEVRVTAEQGSDGEWHATEVEILSKEKIDAEPEPLTTDRSVT